MQEEWRRISGFPNYEMSEERHIRRVDTRAPVHVTHHTNGFELVWLRGSITNRQLGRGVEKLYRDTFPDLAPPKTYNRRSKT